MNLMVTIVYAAVVLRLIAWGLERPDRIYQFPFLAGAMGFSFVLPQLPGLAMDPFLPEGAYARAILFSALCLVMVRLGWDDKSPVGPVRLAFDETRLLAVAAALSLAGAHFYIQLSRLPGDLAVATGLSGATVAQLFFAKLLSYGFGIACLVAARRPSIPALAIAGFDAVLYLDRIVVTGKRGETLEFAMIIALSLWFNRRIVVPRSLVLAGVVLGTFAMGAMSDYRDITRRGERPTLETIAEIPFADNLAETLKAGGPEMRNAIALIDHADRTFSFDYGLFHWNVLVFNYVPAQLVGTKFKESLMVEARAKERTYAPDAGTTETGMADSFLSFWWFGAVKFLLVSAVLAWFWRAAMAGSTVFRLLTMFSVMPAMQIVSHHTQWPVSSLVHMFMFLIPALFLARVPRPGAQSNRTQAGGPVSPATQR